MEMCAARSGSAGRGQEHVTARSIRSIL